jgi:hypothetical protein
MQPQGTAAWPGRVYLRSKSHSLRLLLGAGWTGARRCGSMLSMRAIAILAVAFAFAGCSGNSDGPSNAKSRSKPRLATRVDLNAVGFAMDHLRSAADDWVSSSNDCARLGRAGADSKTTLLCFRSSGRPWVKTYEGVLGMVETARHLASPSPSCNRQLATIVNQLAQMNRAVRDATFAVQGNDAAYFTAKLNAFDRAFGRLNAAYARADTVCRRVPAQPGFWDRKDQKQNAFVRSA